MPSGNVVSVVSMPHVTSGMLYGGYVRIMPISNGLSFRFGCCVPFPGIHTRVTTTAGPSLGMLRTWDVLCGPLGTTQVHVFAFVCI